jgi:hemoglobin/transferrin/lactoferrin receptor protein
MLHYQNQLMLLAIAVLLYAPYSEAAEITPQQRPAVKAKEAPAASAPEQKMGEVTVVGSRSERLVDLTSKSVSVITREQIKARPGVNIQTLLDDVPGISYSRAGGLGGQMVVRGLNSNDPRMVMYVDGDRFRGRNTLEYNLVDPNQIERIEIIRGPASALYGSDAMNGVINIITRRAKGDVNGKFHLSPLVSSVSYNSVNNQPAGRVELAGVGNGVAMLLGFNGRRAGDYESPLGEVGNSDFSSLGGDLRLGYTLMPGKRLELIGKIAEVETGRAGGIGGAPGLPKIRHRENPMRERYLKLGYGDSDPILGLDSLDTSFYVRELYTAQNTENRTAANGNVTLSNIYVDGPVIWGGKLIGTKAWGNNLLTAGADFFHENRKGNENDAVTYNASGAVTSTTVRAQRNRDAEQTNVGIFAHNDWDPSSRWTVSTAGRLDYIRTTVDGSPALEENAALQQALANNLESIDKAATGSIGVIFKPVQQLHLVANAGTAFRAPATFEKFGSFTQAAVNNIANPDLQPETSVTYEAGARLRLPDFHADLTGFYSDYSDLIQIATINATTKQRQNVGSAVIKGIELEGAYDLSKQWSLKFNAATTHGTNTLTNVPLVNVPPLNGMAALRYTSPGQGYYLEGADRWSIRKDRIDPAQERETAGYYNVFSLYAGLDLGKWDKRLNKWRLTAGIDNILDTTYRNAATFENMNFARGLANPLVEPGRSFLVGLTTEY